MKFLRNKLSIRNEQWRVVSDTSVPTTWVIGGKRVYEFEDAQDALEFVADAYRRTADMRQMQPGQSYNLTMTDGTTKLVEVQNQTPEGVSVVDPNSGQAMMIPHVQPGAEPTMAQPGQNAPPTGLTPKPNMPRNQAATPVSPENRTYSRPFSLFEKEAKEPGRVPNNCKHDHSHLLRKEPSDAEKFCPDCGMVYAASKVILSSSDLKTAGCDSDFYVEGDYCSCPAHAGKKKAGGPPFYDDDGDEEHDVTEDAEFRSEMDDRDERKKRKKGSMPLHEDGCTCTLCKMREDRKAKVISEHGECANCGASGKEIDDSGYCAKCRRRKAFRAWKNREKIVRAYDLIKTAEPVMPGQQAMPSAEVNNETLKMDEKSPAEFAEEPDSPGASKPNPNAKRKLTPHEIIEEAENLIRNALAKGVKIGAIELSEYMTTYYQNNPQELMQGIALAWQKVQYEEQMEPEGGEGDPSGGGGGMQAPKTPEEAAQQAPKNGPIQTRRIL